jgi:hypothetical protein
MPLVFRIEETSSKILAVINASCITITGCGHFGTGGNRGNRDRQILRFLLLKKRLVLGCGYAALG